MNGRQDYITLRESREAVGIAALLGFIAGALTVAIGGTLLAESFLSCAGAQ